MDEQSVILGGESWHWNSILKHYRATSTDISVIVYILSEAPAAQRTVILTHTETLVFAAILDIVEREVLGL